MQRLELQLQLGNTADSGARCRPEHGAAIRADDVVQLRVRGCKFRRAGNAVAVVRVFVARLSGRVKASDHGHSWQDGFIVRLLHGAPRLRSASARIGDR